MTPQVDIDPDVLDYLKSKAEPFVDSPSTVLRRLLGLEGHSERPDKAPKARTPASPKPGAQRASRKVTKKQAPRRARAAAGTLLPEDRYELPLLRALVDGGGQAPFRHIVDSVGIQLKDELTPTDFETLTSGTVRWQSRLQFVRLRLIERGYLDRNTPRGIWGITDAGRKALTEGQTNDN